MKSSLKIVPSDILIGLLIGICLSLSMSACTNSSGTAAKVSTAGLTEDDKHRLYAAALAASEFPLESESFKEVCRRIGIFDAGGNQNDNYMAFVTAHLEWAMKTETEQFKLDINTREKAREYINRSLP